MTYRTRNGGASVAVLSLSLGLLPLTAQAAETLSLADVVVEADRPLPASTAVVPGTDAAQRPYSDGGDFLRSLPGVDATRSGGHGLDPVIRGLSQTRLNIIDNDAFVHGACPGRMDPPTSMAAVSLADAVTVTRGYQTVTRYGGGPGGTVVFERFAPPVSDAKPVAGHLGLGYSSNGGRRNADLDVAAGADAGYARAQGHWKEHGNYKDGNGDKVPSSFSQYGGGLELGWTPRDGSRVALGYERSETKDARFAGSMMDSPETIADIMRGKVEHRFDDAGALKGLEASAYLSMVDHTMDNFSLRSPMMMMGQPAYRLTEATSDTWGGRIALDAELGTVPVTFGIDTQTNQRDALNTGSTGNRSLNTILAYTWPDITTQQIGVFAEGTVPVTDNDRLVLGLRYDHIGASWDKADAQAVSGMGAMMRRVSSNDLYRSTYGETAEDRTENNVGGLLRWEHDLSAGVTVHAGLSRTVRTADATERGAASSMMIGNPSLAPEKHHQAQIGIAMAHGDWAIDGVVYHDRVEDFILRDRARGQDGILRTDGTTVYRNVDAALTGIEISGRWNFAPQWSLNGSAFYTHGENLTDDRALPQIPPLQGSLAVEYRPDDLHGDLMVGGRVRAAATQTRIDTQSGLDVEETSGYGVLDLYGSYAITDGVDILFGIDNLFDANYASHLAIINAVDGSVSRVNEPGRAVWLQTRITF